MLCRYRQLFRHVFFFFLFLLVASCSGGGCSGCTSCGGTTSLPGGFPTDKAVENAATVRLSRPGLDFLEKSLPDLASKVANTPNGKMSFSIPNTPFDMPYVFGIGISCPGTLCFEFGMTGEFCVGGPNPTATPPKCTAEVNLGGSVFKIDSVKPNAIVLSAVIPLQLDDTPVHADLNPGPAVTLSVGYGSNGTCTGANSAKASVQPKNLPVKVTIPLVAETISPRSGYTKIDVDKAVVDLSAIDSSDVRICADCGILSDVAGYDICDLVLNVGFIKDYIVDKIRGGLDDMVKSLLKDQLCTAPTPTLNPPCPTDTQPDAANKHCVYKSDTKKCVPMLLGTDAHIDLGGFLQSISPSAAGGLDFGLAAAGSMNPAPGANADGQGHTPNGVTLGMMGGILPQPPSKCVTQAPVTAPTGIPVPDELAPKVKDDATAPHVGIALSGRFLDYSMTSVYNSGLLCLGVSTEQFGMLKSGLLSVLVRSLSNLTFDQADAAAAITTRPQKPPTVKVGGGTNVDTDPLLLITAPEFAIDFYVWSYDRYARIFTFTSDLTIPVNLQAGKDGIKPALGSIKALKGKVTNDNLLFEKPEVIADGLSGLLGAVSKQLLGSGISPIDISGALSSFGLALEVNEIKKLTKDTDDFVGIFATMAKSTAATGEADTTAKLLSKKVDKDHMSLATYAREALPELELELSSPLDDGLRVIEYAWWIDKGTRSIWSTDKHLVIKDDQLFMQGKHVLHVAARVKGEPWTEDATPADVPFAIDALPPFAKIENGKLVAWDLVSPQDALRARAFGGPFGGEWQTLAEVANLDLSKAEEIEVADEEGNIGVVRQGLRGRADPSIGATGSGCGCSTPGKKSSDTNAVLALCLALGGLSFIVLRRRRGSRAAAPVAALVTTLAVASTSQGCACGESEDPGTGCGSDCNQECLTGLHHGQPGSYLSVAKAKDGAVWAAGWNDSGFSEGIPFLYGDLVVGKYDLGKQSVDWETVDGTPVHTDGTCGTYEPGGWRKGETDAGDNVGRWPSIQVSNGGKPMVSYYDDTNGRLKFAINDGGWKTFVVLEKPRADIGRYSKMVLGADGKPIVMFMLVEPGNAGKLRSKVVVARANVEEPHGAEDFRFEDAAVDEDNPCRTDTCNAGEKCVAETGACTKPVAGCTPADCGADKACVTKDNKATCLALVSAIETYPRSMGGYVSLVAGPKGLGAVVYDGFRGNLIALSEAGGKWTRTILDGETGLRSNNTAHDTGDVGMAASLAISPSGQWHVSYVNGIDETLRYITFADGKPGKTEIVDDGTEVDGKVFPDGRHLVGDDSAIRVDGDIVTILYTDNHSLGVRKAVGATAGGTRKWDRRSVALSKTWVKFPAFVPAEDRALAFWTQVAKSNQSIDGDVIMLP